MERSFLHIPTRVELGINAIEQIGDLAIGLGARRAVIVTDHGIVAAGHMDRARASLVTAGLEVAVFDSVHENPTTETVDACCEAFQDADADVLVGLGGGSSIDTARGANFLLSCGGRMQDYWGVGKATAPMHPLIAVPTTTGTGSEMQAFALITDPKTRQKMACGDKRAASTIAILDPTLAVTQPRQVRACTGLDCLSHALEAAVTRTRTSLSVLFASESWRLGATTFARVLEAPDDLKAEQRMLTAAAYAGVAIEHSMLGATHAMANPLTARFGVIHGQAVGVMLPHVIRFNCEDDQAASRYARLGRLVSEEPLTDERAIATVLEWVERALDVSGSPTLLSAFGVTADAIDDLAVEAARQWTAGFNPREVGPGDFVRMYQAAL